MLNGIGGRTVKEAKRSITEFEFRQWCLYREKFGSLNPNVSVDRGLGVVAYILQAANGGKAKYSDFVPDYRDDDQKMQDEIQQLSKEWK